MNEDKKEEEEQVKEEDNKENGKESTTIIQSFTAIQYSCTGGQENCLFLSRKQ